ncbi:MAG: AI-2E family transporter [Candidatus Moraniibacteriota bacterium]|nr:MAG: AI-2E family transporter [Candidatus Moranbacteria bacterium]
MRIPHFNTIFFFFVFFLTGAAVFFVMQPFLTSMLVAAVLATLFYGRYQSFLRVFGGRKGLSAGSVLLLVAFLVIIPIFVLATLVIGEATSALTTLSSGTHSLGEVSELIQLWLSRLPVVGEFLSEKNIRIADLLGNVVGKGGALISFLQALYGSVAGLVLWIFALFFALFYFLIDGDRVIRLMKRMSPLSDRDDEELMRDFSSMSRAVIKGSISIALLQGVIGGIGVAVAGVSSPAIWGAAMGFFSLIPAVGSGIVWLPMGLWLFFSGDVWQGIFLLVFGMSIISTVDNVVRPKLVGRDTQIHPLLVFFSTLGGIALFGIVGLLIGPLLVSFFLALTRIYVREFKADLDTYNQGGLAS